MLLKLLSCVLGENQEGVLITFMACQSFPILRDAVTSLVWECQDGRGRMVETFVQLSSQLQMLKEEHGCLLLNFPKWFSGLNITFLKSMEGHSFFLFLPCCTLSPLKNDVILLDFALSCLN